MMKKALQFALLSGFVLATASRAGAGTITDVFDPTDQLFTSGGAACVGTNGLTDVITGASSTAGCSSLAYLIQLVGYSQPPDTLTSASLELTFRDDTDRGRGNPETVVVTLNNVLQGSFTIANSPFNFDVKTIVKPNGDLDVLLAVGQQGTGQADFLFEKSVLNAAWTDGDGEIDPQSASPVPEPATMFLMSSGLGTMAYRRWRSKKA